MMRLHGCRVEFHYTVTYFRISPYPFLLVQQVLIGPRHTASPSSVSARSTGTGGEPTVEGRNTPDNLNTVARLLSRSSCMRSQYFWREEGSVSGGAHAQRSVLTRTTLRRYSTPSNARGPSPTSDNLYPHDSSPFSLAPSWMRYPGSMSLESQNVCPPHPTSSDPVRRLTSSRTAWVTRQIYYNATLPDRRFREFQFNNLARPSSTRPSACPYPLTCQ